mmetsp:Transcript_30839/g.66774  ORF Transcript_30839/g.66774 Transcript_30839/m.66774 type:complete len:207 (-) Transcript_30839:296-916(-)
MHFRCSKDKSHSKERIATSSGGKDCPTSHVGTVDANPVGIDGNVLVVPVLLSRVGILHDTGILRRRRNGRLLGRRRYKQSFGIGITPGQTPIGAQKPNVVVVVVNEEQSRPTAAAPTKVDFGSLGPSPPEALAAPRDSIARAVQDEMSIVLLEHQVVPALLGGPDDLVVLVEEEDADEVEAEADGRSVVGIGGADVLVGVELAAGR